MEYTFYSNILMICNCHSYTNIVPINLHIAVKLKCNDYSIQYLQELSNKPNCSYTILLYDLYEKKYWIYTETNPIIETIISEYVISNKQLYEKCFIEMKLFLLQKLINYDTFLFRTCFISYYNLLIQNQEYQKIYYDQFIQILDELVILNTNQPSRGETKMGVYFVTKYDNFFDDLLHIYSISPCRNNTTITDANYIISCINIICK